MSKPFFPTYRDNWTRTPNVFFDEVLKTDGVTLNEVRIIGYLIRQTLGYNKDAKWTAVTRKELISEAGVPNGRIKGALDKCKEHGWILIYEEGEGPQKKRYIFLNDERNQLIVKGLEQGKFDINSLKYLNEAGIQNLLESHGLFDDEEENKHSSTETVQENVCSSTETVQGLYRNGRSNYTETVEADKGKTQAPQEFAQPLNTSFKDSIYKDINNKKTKPSNHHSYSNKKQKRSVPVMIRLQNLQENEYKLKAALSDEKGKGMPNFSLIGSIERELKEVQKEIRELEEQVMAK